jgi:hypothetical protein
MRARNRRRSACGVDRGSCDGQALWGRLDRCARAPDPHTGCLNRCGSDPYLRAGYLCRRTCNLNPHAREPNPRAGYLCRCTRKPDPRAREPNPRVGYLCRCTRKPNPRACEPSPIPRPCPARSWTGSPGDDLDREPRLQIAPLSKHGSVAYATESGYLVDTDRQDRDTVRPAGILRPGLCARRPRGLGRSR